MRANGTARAILGRRLSGRQLAMVEAAPELHRLGAFWRTLKFGHPWPRHQKTRR